MRKGWIASADEVWASDEFLAKGDLDAREQAKVDGPAAASSSSSSAGAQASEPPAKKAQLDKRPLEA